MENVSKLPLALCHVSGRRVAWSSDPEWFPRDQARGPAYSKARRRGRAGRTRENADSVIVKLLNSGAVRGVLVTGEGLRAAYVTQSAIGRYRTAWSESDRWWPTLDPQGPAFEQTKAAGHAGVVFGLDAMREILLGGIVQERDWRSEEARALANKEQIPSLEARAIQYLQERGAGSDTLRRVG